MFEALPPEPITLGNASANYLRDLARRNIFTEPYGDLVYPMKQVSEFHPGLEVGYVRDGRAGGAYMAGSIAKWLWKQRERGRTALPNLECSGAGRPGALAGCLLSAYAYGVRYATLYNTASAPDAPGEMAAFVQAIEKPISLAATSAKVGDERKSDTYEVRVPEQAFGFNRIDLKGVVPGTDLSGAILELVDVKSGDILSVALSSQNALQAGGNVAVRLPTLFFVTPADTIRAIVRARAATAIPASGGWWKRVEGVSFSCDAAAERARSLVVQQWQDTVDLLESIGRLHSSSQQPPASKTAYQSAQSEFDDLHISEAYAAGIAAEQVALPCRFTVPAPGRRLVPYWINVDCSAPVEAKLATYGDRSASVVIRSQTAQTVTLRWGGKSVEAKLTAGIPASLEITRPKPKRVVPIKLPAKPLFPTFPSAVAPSEPRQAAPATIPAVKPTRLPRKPN
jgi:hypothetical protein